MQSYRRKLDIEQGTMFAVEMGPIMFEGRVHTVACAYPFPKKEAALLFAENHKKAYLEREIVVRSPQGEAYSLQADMSWKAS
jgi:hypothetical protein